MNKKVIIIGLGIAVLIIAMIVGVTYFKSIDNPKNNNQVSTNALSKNEGIFALEVKDKEGNPVQSLNFIIYDNEMQEVITITTNSNGQAGAKNLPYGKYHYKEESADKTESFELTEAQKIVTVRMTREVNEN
ncbi:MAG: hypothetical protein IJ223_04860 [Clostridia bacterium]|nr:hypothetical protein [Clostridia bacterium]